MSVARLIQSQSKKWKNQLLCSASDRSYQEGRRVPRKWWIFLQFLIRILTVVLTGINFCCIVLCKRNDCLFLRKKRTPHLFGVSLPQEQICSLRKLGFQEEWNPVYLSNVLSNRLVKLWMDVCIPVRLAMIWLFIRKPSYQCLRSGVSSTTANLHVLVKWFVYSLHHFQQTVSIFGKRDYYCPF